MYTDSSLKPIGDDDQYTSPEGIKYPWNYPKDSIADLFPVTLVAAPTGNVIVSGFHIENVNGVYTQVWTSTTMTDAQVAAAAAAATAATDSSQASNTTNQIAALYALLLNKGVIQASDLPAPLQTTLAANIASLSATSIAIQSLSVQTAKLTSS